MREQIKFFSFEHIAKNDKIKLINWSLVLDLGNSCVCNFKEKEKIKYYSRFDEGKQLFQTGWLCNWQLQQLGLIRVKRYLRSTYLRFYICFFLHKIIRST